MEPQGYIRIPGARIPQHALFGNLRAWLPSRGNVLFTLLIVAAFFWVQSIGAFPNNAPRAFTSTGTIAYQGRLANASGSPVTGTYNMLFRLYNASSGGTPLREEYWMGKIGRAHV